MRSEYIRSKSLSLETKQEPSYKRQGHNDKARGKPGERPLMLRVQGSRIKSQDEW
jgi:hypothetical protein